MPADALLGIDIGTTHTKGILIGVEGETLAEASRPSDLISAHPNWAEMDPEQWWSNACAVCQELTERARSQGRVIAAIGVSGMVPALVLLDREGVPVRRSIQQNDARTTVEIDELKALVDENEFFESTGGSINQQILAPKLRWLARHEPRALASARRIMGSYDYIVLRLTGVASAEHNWALESGLVDLRRRQWDSRLVGLAGIEPGQLPPIRASDEVVGHVTPSAAEATGCPAGTPVIAGVADHVSSAFAAGVMDSGDLLIKFGGAGDILFATPDLVTDTRLFIDYHVIPDSYLLNGCMATSGSMLKWLADTIFEAGLHVAEGGGNVFARLDEGAARVPAGSQGIVVLPYFLGEKTPLHDPHARGTIIGLGLHHDRNHVYRAFLEAVVFGFRHHVDVLDELGLQVKRVLASDGGAKSDLWLQIAADVLAVPVRRVERHPGASLGAAFIAGKALGLFDDWRAVTDFVESGRPFLPRPAVTSVYDQAYGLYRACYDQLKDLFPALGSLAAQETPSGGS